MNIETVSKDIHVSNHQAWLQNGVTAAAASLLQARLDRLIDFIADKANDKATTDAEIRQVVSQIRVIKLIQKEQYVTESFVQALGAKSN